MKLHKEAAFYIAPILAVVFALLGIWLESEKCGLTLILFILISMFTIIPFCGTKNRPPKITVD